MADKKIEKALYGPSTTEVALGAILGLIAGLLVACVYLVFKPVLQVKELPKEPVRGAVYYLPGSESKAKSQGWERKLKALTAGTPVVLTEDEANAWATATFGERPAAAPAAGAAPAKAATPGEGAWPGLFNPETPNFRFAHSRVQIAAKCVLDWFGLRHEVTLLSEGLFERQGDDVVYVPESFYLGSCPLHYLPWVDKPLFAHLVGKKKIPDEVRSAWAKVREATVEGATLKITIE